MPQKGSEWQEPVVRDARIGESATERPITFRSIKFSEPLFDTWPAYGNIPACNEFGECVTRSLKRISGAEYNTGFFMHKDDPNTFTVTEGQYQMFVSVRSDGVKR